MSRPEVVPVILSGGSGTRLWPVSLPHRPKQLQALVEDRTMLQATVERMTGFAGVTPPVVICNEVQVDEVVSQLGATGHSPATVLVEPAARNTAPAIAAAALGLAPDAIMVVLPADHVIADVEAFQNALAVAVGVAGQGGIVTFGIVPTRAETGFGYVELGEPRGEAFELSRFVEKPDAETAEHYVDSGNYLWNSGMFVFTAGAILAELEAHVPEVAAAARTGVETATIDATICRLGPAFATAPSISIDYAVMERTQSGVVVPLAAGWSDVGSWQSLWEATSGDGANVTVGPVFTHDVARSYVRSAGRPIAVVGIDDVVVVETPEAILVLDRRRAQDVRAAAEWFAARPDA